MSRRALIPVIATAALALTALPAQAAVPPLASDVTLSTHTVKLGSAAGKDLSSYPAVVRIKGVSSAAAKAMATAITSKGRGLVRPKGLEPKTSATVTALVAEADRTYVSVLFTSSYYTAGGAHPYDLQDTLVFVRSTGAVLGFKDVFKDPGKALPVLDSELRRNARYALGPAYDKASVGFGLDNPTVDSIGQLVPRPWGVEVFFDQGDLAADAYGTSSILVPWDVLKPLLKITLPTLGGNVPNPAYGGGEAITQKDLLTGISLGVTQGIKDGVRGLSGRAAGSYRLIDSRQVSAYISSDATDNLYVTTLVPFAQPSKALAVLVALGGDEGHPSFDVIDVQRGAVGCGVVSSAFIKALKEKCPA